MSEEIYNRQQSLGLDIPKSVMVVGTGGVGYWLSMFLAMSGVKILHIVDPDNVELSNLNRLPITEKAVNVSKVEALKEHLLNLRPDCTVFAHNKKFNNLLTSSVEWIVSCTDNVKSQKQTEIWSKKIKAKFVRAGYDGMHLTLSGGIPDWGEDERVGYTVTPSWVIPSVLIAAFAVAKMLRFPDLSIASDIGKLGEMKTIEEVNVSDGNVMRLSDGTSLPAPIKLDISGKESLRELWDIMNCELSCSLDLYLTGKNRTESGVERLKGRIWNFLNRHKGGNVW